MTHEIYNKTLPLLFKSSDNHQERKTQVQIFIKQISSSSVNRKDLEVHLTSDSDHFFLFFARLSEENFKSLKVELGLLVDFSEFSQHLVTLLDRCAHDENKHDKKYLLELVGGGEVWCLKVQEQNSFRLMTHVSLRFSAGNDHEIKQHLSQSLVSLQEKSESRIVRLEEIERDLRSQLRQAREALAARTEELSTVKPEYNVRINELINKHTAELSIEREKLAQMQSGLEEKCESVREHHQSIVTQLESRIEQLDKTSKELLAGRQQAESVSSELRSRLVVVEEENMRLRRENESMRRDSETSGSDRNELHRFIAQLNTRLAVLEQELRDKDQIINNSRNMLESERDTKKRQEEELERKKRQISQLDSAYKSVSAELMKANDIIRKLQSDIKNYHNKLKIRTQVSGEQEKLLVEKQREIEEGRKEVEGLKNSVTEKLNEINKLTESLQINNDKLEESKQLLKTNENVISWLNKQITDTQLSTHRPVTAVTAAGAAGIERGAAGGVVGGVMNQSAVTGPYQMYTPPTLLNGHKFSSSTSLNRFSSSTNPHLSPHYTSGDVRQGLVVAPRVSNNDNKSAPVINNPRQTTQRNGTQSLDVKYLQKTSDVDPGGAAGVGAPLYTPTHTSHPPLASAYFPSKVS